MRSMPISLAAILVLALASTTALAKHGGHTVHWSGADRHFPSHDGRFHRHERFLLGYEGFAAYDYGCWRWQPTPWGWRHAWVCGYPYYGYF